MAPLRRQSRQSMALASVLKISLSNGISFYPIRESMPLFCVPKILDNNTCLCPSICTVSACFNPNHSSNAKPGFLPTILLTLPVSILTIMSMTSVSFPRLSHQWRPCPIDTVNKTGFIDLTVSSVTPVCVPHESGNDLWKWNDKATFRMLSLYIFTQF